MKMNKYHLEVFDELRNDEYFFKANNLIRYNIPPLEGNMLPNDIGKKVMAVWDLRKWGAIIIHNEDRFSNKLEYEFEILVEQPAFNSIYEECIRKVAKMDLEEYRLMVENEDDMPAMTKKLNEFIRLNSIKGLRLKLLESLSGFDPISTSQLKSTVSSKSLPSLRVEVNKHLKKSGFYIKSLKPKEIGKTGEYQLVYDPTSNGR